MIRRDEATSCPYVGLQPFTEADRDFFFGRERDQRVIVSNILAVPLTILYGSSGVGKSSVLIAGVVPHLKERNDCAVIVFRDWQHKGFADELKKTCIAAVSLSDGVEVVMLQSLPLDDLLYQLGEESKKTILVIFDQFEEYFFYHPVGPLSDTFESEFARAINRDEVDVKCLIALREDSLHKLDRLRARIRNLLGNSLRLEQIDRNSAERAIRMPLKVYNERFSTHFSIEDDLVKEVLNQTRAGPLAVGFHSDIGTVENREPTPQGAVERIETPFLQLVMERLWEEEREESSVLRLITFQRLGGANEIARSHLERKLGKLRPEERMVCVEFFDRLVTPSGSKVACRLDDLIQWAGKLAEQVPDILKHLEDGRILRKIEASSGDKDAPPLYEVFHDILAGAILEWRKQYLKEREIAEATRQAEEGRKQAEEKTKRAEQERANQRERAEEEARNAAKFKTLSRALILALILAIMAVVWSWKATLVAEEHKAKAQEASAISSLRERIARAINFLDSDPELCGILARETLKDASRIHDIAVAKEATDALSRALAVSTVRLNFPASNSRTIGLAYASKRGVLATVSEDGTAKLWDAKSGKLRHSLSGSTAGLHQASFSPNEDLLAACNFATNGSGCAYVWNVDSGELVQQLSVKGSDIVDVAFRPDGHLVATGTQSGTVQVWDTASWKSKEISFDKLGLGPVVDIAFDPTGKRITTAHSYGVTLLDPDTGEEHALGSKEGGAHNATVTWVAFSPDGRRLATASADKTAKLWDAKTGKLERTLKGHSDMLNFAEFSPNGKQVVTCGQDFDVRVWDAETGELIHTLSGHTDSVFKAIFSPSGKLIASVSADDSARLWNAETGRFLFSLKGHAGPIQDLEFSSDGNTVFTTSWDGMAKAWTINSRHVGPVNQVLFSKTGQLATAGSDGTVKLWDPVSGEVLQTLSGHQQPVQAVAFTSDGMRLATASVDHSVKIWDTVTGKEIAALQGHKDAVRDVVYNPKRENTLATAGFDSRVLLWVAGNGEKPAELGSHQWQALHLAFSPDGSRLASAGSGDAIIWDVNTKGKICMLIDPKLAEKRAHDNPITQIRFSPEGDYIVTCSEDCTAKIWRASDGHLVNVLNNHKNLVSDAEFNPHDGQTVITASYDKTAKLWEVSSGNLLETLTGHTAPLIAARFDCAGIRIATASLDGTTKIWTKNRPEPSGKASFSEILTLTSSGQVKDVDFSPDGSRIAIASSTGEVIMFPFDGEELMTLANKRFTRPLRPEE